MDFSIGLYPMYNANPIPPVYGSDRVTRGSEGPVVTETKKTECQTCKNRTYVDGSNESNVSFKAPGHIDPAASGAVVMGHEQEHVANARAEGSQAGKKLISATVSLQMSICPECGRAYVSGGTTKTTMKTTSSIGSENPYVRAANQAATSLLSGSHVDLTA